jgi:hypothetical protein
LIALPTRPACKVLDVTVLLNLGSALAREQYMRRIANQ